MEIKLTNAGVALQCAANQQVGNKNLIKEQRDKVEQARRWAQTAEGRAVMSGYRSIKNTGTGRNKHDGLVTIDAQV